MPQVMLSAASRAGKTNHSAVRAIRSPGTCRVVRRIPIAREQKRLAHASATPDRTKSSSKSITKSKKGFSRSISVGAKYLKKTCPCNGTQRKPR